MGSVRVLDVTLRDGGCVNDFNFGQAYMERILSAQEAAGVDIIELGYLDGERGSAAGRTQFSSDAAIRESLLRDKKQGATYVAMIDYGKFDIDSLGRRASGGIDGIRLAFHKKDLGGVAEAGRKIMGKGYQLYVQPMVTMRYTDMELLGLVRLVNEELPGASAFYIVDSFGEMRPNDLARVWNLVDHNLAMPMAVGFHSHNNLQMSYSNAVTLLRFATNRAVIIDSSVMGMGKGAGNLNTELLLEHLNLFYGKGYRVGPLLQLIDKVINQLHAEYGWGYAPEYYLSSANRCTPSYASYFYNRHMLPIDAVGQLLGMLDEDKKCSFDPAYAEEAYLEFNAAKVVDDTQAVRELEGELSGRAVLLIAPGRSIAGAACRIRGLAGRAGVAAVGLNLLDDFGQGYILATRKDVFDTALARGDALIAPSSISKGARGNVRILDYGKWVDGGGGGQVHDSSAVIAFNLLRHCRVREVYLAGFDGFSAGINDNYYDPLMRFPMREGEARRKNEYYSGLVRAMRQDGMEVVFVTPSKYDMAAGRGNLDG